MWAFKHWDPITEKNQILPAFTLSIIEVLLQCEINFSQNCFKVKGIFFPLKADVGTGKNSTLDMYFYEILYQNWI